MHGLSRQQARQLDTAATEQFGVPGIVLMENAGRGVADALVHLGVKSPVAICGGRGNNAGEGFVVARHLDLRGIRPILLLWSDPQALLADAAANFRIVQRSGIEVHQATGDEGAAAVIEALRSAKWIVDALLGTGLRGAPRPPLDQAIGQINGSGIPVLSIDLPSGLDCDEGTAAGAAVRATHTCTFVAPKQGFSRAAAAEYLGHLHVLDIGAPRCLVEAMTQGA